MSSVVRALVTVPVVARDDEVVPLQPADGRADGSPDADGRPVEGADAGAERGGVVRSDGGA